MNMGFGWWSMGNKGLYQANILCVWNLDGKKVIFRDTLQLENLDINEIEGSLNSLALLLSEFSGKIIEFGK